MKNIHILPTQKQSRLSIRDIDNKLCIHRPEVVYRGINQRGINQNIYITSDEEIKKGDWYIDTSVFKENIAIDRGIYQMKYFKWGIEGQGDCKKIILTTDQDLIKDGVQAIDDEFLEWFVNNPSCEEVEVEKMFNMIQLTSREYIYYIIIPRTTQQIINEDYAGGLEMGQIIQKEETKQETFEEFAERISKGNGSDNSKEIMEGICGAPQRD